MSTLDVNIDMSKTDNLHDVIDNNQLIAIKKINSDSKKLIVMLNGAVNRTISQPPVFQRKTWLDYLPYNVIIIPDKTVEINDTLELGWYLGEHNKEYIHEVAQLVANTANELNINNDSIVFYGSSGGGYAAIILSTLIIGSSAISINPQITLNKYIKRIFDKFMADTGHNHKYSFLDATLCMETQKYIPRITIIQNKNDHLHYNEHFKKFLHWYIDNSNKISNLGDLTINTFIDEKGHNAMPNVYESMPYIDKKLSNSYLVATKSKETAPTIRIYTSSISMTFKMVGINDRALIFIKSNLSEDDTKILISKGWMISPKVGVCKYVTKSDNNEIIKISFDYLLGFEIGILHWQSDNNIEYKILNQ
ncbi:TPA: YqiA/YcfP family alpha/beta fold hydrolase [Escherichia coli]|uniref:YqiA/YcfP family alpha/beta fold hydrolase n=1 Tax=Escherichia coli TaxID=562 RepID=UPI001653C198|nr:YqiA/YcfP family alpha/beta fold hydrolase [Escherichia coli]EHK6829005.1 hypothetical protein [Escherichia coli]EKG2217255.1 hypothetical protein [Escherichia coli]HAP3175598.1 hypothetical protein [Escherichia coli]